MNRWSVTVTGAEGERDQTEISDVSDLARTVGAAVIAGATSVSIVSGDSPDLVEDGDGAPFPEEMQPHLRRLVSELEQVRAAEGDDQYIGAIPLADAVEALLQSRALGEAETGREAALGQWEARWAAVRVLLTNAVMPVADHYLRGMDRIEAAIPTGLPTGDGRINVRLEPERVTELVRILDGIATLKVHSMGTNNAAMNLSADIVRMAEQQGWRR